MTPPRSTARDRTGARNTARPSSSIPPEQEAAARAKIEQLNAEGRFKPKRIVTKVEPAQTFWRAEEYHQRYLEKRGQASCHI